MFQGFNAVKIMSSNISSVVKKKPATRLVNKKTALANELQRSKDFKINLNLQRTMSIHSDPELRLSVIIHLSFRFPRAWLV